MIFLRDINEENWVKCVMLNPNKEGQVKVANKFVDSVAYSIVWATIDKNLITKAIYDEDKLIGFCMYGFCTELQSHKIYSILIDAKCQNKGYGRKVVKLLIDTIRQINGVKSIYLTFNPENKNAKGLYESFGFVNTGERFKLPDEVINDVFNGEYSEKDDEFLYCFKL